MIDDAHQLAYISRTHEVHEVYNRRALTQVGVLNNVAAIEEMALYHRAV